MSKNDGSITTDKPNGLLGKWDEVGANARGDGLGSDRLEKARQDFATVDADLSQAVISGRVTASHRLRALSNITERYEVAGVDGYALFANGRPTAFVDSASPDPHSQAIRGTLNQIDADLIKAINEGTVTEGHRLKVLSVLSLRYESSPSYSALSGLLFEDGP